MKTSQGRMPWLVHLRVLNPEDYSSKYQFAMSRTSGVHGDGS
jgi:hypothetical protein